MHLTPVVSASIRCYEYIYPFGGHLIVNPIWSQRCQPTFEYKHIQLSIHTRVVPLQWPESAFMGTRIIVTLLLRIKSSAFQAQKFTLSLHFKGWRGKKNVWETKWSARIEPTSVDSSVGTQLNHWHFDFSSNSKSRCFNSHVSEAILASHVLQREDVVSWMEDWKRQSKCNA